MKNPTDIFTEKETIVGYVETDSGSLLITDGIWEDRINLNPRNKVAIDLGVDRVRVPVIATKQNDRRFLLIPLDQAEALRDNMDDKVEVEEPSKQPEKKKPEKTDV
jgi:hypothetical protein